MTNESVTEKRLNRALGYQLTPISRLVFYALIALAKDQPVVLASGKRLCLSTGLSRNSVKAGIRDLVALGEIVATNRNMDGANLPKTFTFTDTLPELNQRAA